ncbi:MAG: hypothetical protein ABEI27_04125 [Halobellus sp.]|uniref:DUF7096 domain-containing protein n=1 Tax=Halobellus sp. TaxID=1979212 RepID=UPI0035D52178
MRTVSALLIAVVVVAAAPAGVVAAAGTVPTTSALAQAQDGETVSQTTATNATGTETTASDSGNDTASSNGTAIAPGAQLAGVIGVQATEIDSEVESRTFGQRVAAAASNESKADVVAGALNESRDRLSDLRERLTELDQARENGTISQGRYRAEIAQITAEINSLEERLERANETAISLPEPVREQKGINHSNIEQLREEARNLSGPETAEIARGIAGDNPGRGMGAGPPEADDDAPGRRDGSGPNDDAPESSGDASGRDNDADQNTTTDRGGDEQGAPGAGDSTSQTDSQSGDGNETDSEEGGDSRDGNGSQSAGNGGSENGPYGPNRGGDGDRGRTTSGDP